VLDSRTKLPVVGRFGPRMHHFYGLPTYSAKWTSGPANARRQETGDRGALLASI
jgi:hypothetical protein